MGTKSGFSGVYPMVYALFDKAGNLSRRAMRMQIEAMLHEDFSHAHEVTEAEYLKAPYLKRLAMHVARLFDPVL